MADTASRPPFDVTAMRAHAGDAAQLLKALANENRLQVLCLLAEGERSVGEINALLDLSQSALSQHLSKLRAQNLVTTRRDAQTIYYSSKSEAVLTILDALDRIYGKGASAGAAQKKLRIA